GLSAEHIRDPTLQRLGRILPWLLRVLPVRALEHPRVPPPPAAAAGRAVGHDAAAGAARPGRGHRRRHQPGPVPWLAAFGTGLEAGGVPFAPGHPAALPRLDRRPAAAPQRLGTPGPGRRPAGRRVPRPAGAREAGAQGVGVGAHRPGDAPGHRAGGARRPGPGRGRAGAGCAGRRHPRQAALAPRTRRRAGGGAMSARLAGWLFVGPALLVLGLFFALPVVSALALSLTDFGLYALADMRNLRFVALDNYLELLRTPPFRKALWNTTYFVVVGVPLSVAVSLGAALLLNAPAARLRGLFRTALFAPVVTTLVAVAVIWRYLFHTSYGLVNWALGHLGIDPVDWLGDPRWAMPTIILFAVW